MLILIHMDMLTKEDLNEIGKLIGASQVVLEKKIEESSDKVIAAVGEMLEQNVLPQIDEIRVDLGDVKKDVVGIKATMVTKDYLDEKLGVVRGDMEVKPKDFNRRLTSLESPT